MKIIAEKVGSALLGEGYHDVVIDSVEEVTSKPSDEYDDTTPQLSVVFKNDEGFITAWYNLLGYKTFDELTAAEQKSGNFEASSNGYAVKIIRNKAGKIIKRERVIDDERTEKCLRILRKLAFNAGFEDGKELDSEELVGKKVGIAVKTNSQNQLRVEWSFPYGQAAEIAKKEEAKAAEIEEDNF